MDVTMELFCRLAVVNRQGGDIEDFSSGLIRTRKINNKSTSSEASFIIVGASPNHTGIRYNLNGNIEHLSTEFLNRGHVTVCLKEPNWTIYLTNADPKKLTEFISYFKQLLPTDLVMAASEPPNSRINLNLRFQQTYKLRMKYIIDMNINLDHFTELEICDCSLELAGYQLPIAGAIRNMKNLTTLRLIRIELRSSIFLEIESKELKQLHLSKCKTGLQVSSLFKNDLRYKDSLVELNLEGNQWSEIPNGIFQFQNLIQLSLMYNSITKLPDMFTNLHKLQELKLSYNKLTHVPPSIFQMENLLELLLDSNDITELPNISTNSFKLQVLSLCYNRLTLVPPSIFALQNLSKLSLSDNFITELPDKFANLPKLQVLSLSNNQLRDLPSSIFPLQNLSVLNLNGNLITELPDIISLPKLKGLMLCNNELTNVPSSIFEMQNLSVLLLSGNGISELPDTFTNLSKLKHLSLSYNRLQYLPPSICSLHLKKLDIGYNEFNSEIPPSFGSEVIVHSLKELSYRTILNHRLKVEEGILPEKFLKDLDNYRQCICGCKFVDEGQDLLFSINLNDILNFTCYTDNRHARVPIRGEMCTSLKSCFQSRFLSVN